MVQPLTFICDRHNDCDVPTEKRMEILRHYPFRELGSIGRNEDYFALHSAPLWEGISSSSTPVVDSVGLQCAEILWMFAFGALLSPTPVCTDVKVYTGFWVCTDVWVCSTDIGVGYALTLRYALTSGHTRAFGYAPTLIQAVGLCSDSLHLFGQVVFVQTVRICSDILYLFGHVLHICSDSLHLFRQLVFVRTV